MTTHPGRDLNPEHVLNPGEEASAVLHHPSLSSQAQLLGYSPERAIAPLLTNSQRRYWRQVERFDIALDSILADTNNNILLS